MSDLDFDELDKAVSTLMGDVPKVEPVKDDDIKTLSIAPTLTDDSRPSLTKLDAELSKVNNITPVAVEKPAVISASPAPSLAARRGGRFMDVVHPSSDMKGVVKPVMMTSRQGTTIEPTSATVSAQADEQVNETTTTDGPTDATSDVTTVLTSGEKTDAQSEREAPKNDWPDPLDMSAYAKEPDTSSVVSADESNGVSALPVVADKDDDMKPLVSPFLPDTKVEKRPLGGAPVEEVKENDDTQDEELGRAPALGVVAADNEAVENASEQLPADPGMIDQPLPPELQSDLMAIETDGGTSSAGAFKVSKEADLSAADQPKDTAAVAPVVPIVEKKPLGEVTASAAGATAATLVGPTSIPQQYHEEPTTSDQTNGAIYDTDSYHQPLAHPAKTKSGWLWIVWILLLLMIGGGGAVALYFLGII